MNASMTAIAVATMSRAGRWPDVGDCGGPGHVDPIEPARALIFDTAKDGLREDALARFFAAEVGELDWLADYMLDDSVLEMGEEEGPSFAVEPQEELEYERKALTTTATDSGWDIT